MLLTSVGWANSYYQREKAYTDEWGIGWRPCAYQTPFGRGFYTEVMSHPLAADKAIDAYRPPDRIPTGQNSTRTPKNSSRSTRTSTSSSASP